MRQGNDFVVCDRGQAAPWASAPQWVHETYGFFLAVLTFAIVYGAFTAQVLYGAMRAVPHAQMETAEAYGMTHSQAFWRILVPQMWVYALPGLGNLWMILIKATPLLFLLGIEDIVYWARELGGTKAAQVHRLSARRLADVVLSARSWCSTSLLTWVSETGARPADDNGSHAARRRRRAMQMRKGRAAMSCLQTIADYGLALHRDR